MDHQSHAKLHEMNFPMIAGHTAASPAHYVHGRRLARTAVLTAVALALSVSVFAHPAIARASYDPGYYQWCQASLKQSSSYCCQQAGGVIYGSGGGCYDPADIYTPAPPTLNRNQGPIIIVPPGTAATP
jgi:hypothetical protein